MNKKTILLVDDDIAVRNFLRFALETNYNILEASGYHEVIKQLENHVDLALIDYILPNTNGLKILKVLREIKPALPVIIITGYDNENIAIKALRNQVSDYIKKPIDLSFLERRLSEILC